MPRANRHFLQGYIWHITHRCHRRDFLLKFARDRRRWLYWLFEAKKRFGLCVLNYIVTSNHIHLLVLDRGKGEIANSMQLIAGRTAQEYNQRKGRLGAYWQDRYHATAVDTQDYLARCMVYIDLNMVRAGVVSHPREWVDSGYRELQHPPKRYRVIDCAALIELFGIGELNQFQQEHAGWIEEALKSEKVGRDQEWSSSLAVGSSAFVAQVQRELGMQGHHREILQQDGMYILKEGSECYKSDSDLENIDLRSDNRVFIDEYL
jgi:putative transposase